MVLFEVGCFDSKEDVVVVGMERDRKLRNMLG